MGYIRKKGKQSEGEAFSVRKFTVICCTSFLGSKAGLSTAKTD